MADARPQGVPDDAVDLSGDGGLWKRILREGEGDERPASGQEVQVHYTGVLLDGTKFDSSRDRPGNFSFQIGKGAVIKGWDQGVATMAPGELAELFCRADYAYGERGSPPKIPGGATLKFEVELLSFADKAKEKWELSAQEKLDEAAKHKASGTAAFKAGKFAAAMSSYSTAAGYVDSEADFGTEDEKAQAGATLVSCCLNEASAALKLGEWNTAQDRCTTVLARDATSVKALFRRGEARMHLSEFAASKADLVAASKLDPKSREARATAPRPPRVPRAAPPPRLPAVGT